MYHLIDVLSSCAFSPPFIAQFLLGLARPLLPITRNSAKEARLFFYAAQFNPCHSGRMRGNSVASDPEMNGFMHQHCGELSGVCLEEV